MSKEITPQDILNLLEKQAIEFDRRMRKFDESLEKERKEREKSQKEFEARLEKERKEREKSQKEFEARLEKERKEYEARLEKEQKEREKRDKAFDKKIGKIGNVLGWFVEGMIEPRLKDLFQEQGIPVSLTIRSVTYEHNGQPIAETDFTIVNDKYVVIVEVKTNLTTEDVKDHIKRLNIISQFPNALVKGKIILGAVAGMNVRSNVQKYAMEQGLYVLKQKGEIVEIVNDKNFKPREWKVK
ncbi:MAG: hypothetical protein D6767_06805 [Candidatus Hydrogenedentota bacterium]|nr:MAG: hypothetical protein D6767_06805 [Candidatus Hydrogenedentota bacterium]